MAYYDRFTKNSHGKRDDWRDDEKTRRPKRDEGRAVPTEGRERRPYERREDGKDRRFHERRFSEGQIPGRGQRPYGQDEEGKRPYEGRPQRHGERAHGKRDGGQERRPYEARPQRHEHPAYEKREDRRERRPYEAGPEGSEHRFYERDPRERGYRPHGEPPIQPGRVIAPPPPPAPEPDMESNLLVGRNPIREALRAGRDMEKLLVARGELLGSAREIVAMARERRVIVQEVDRARLDAMAPNHQGLIAVVSAFAYSSVEEMLELAASRGEAPFLVILDGVTDPHNLGAIIRSAECAGAHGVIIPQRRAVGLTPAAVKASAGAVEHIPVARETNLTRVLERLKKAGIWIYGAAMQGEDYRKVDFSGPAALVIGSEGEGISRLVLQECDRLVSLPVRGKIDSLNASVAAGVLLYAMAAARA